MTRVFARLWILALLPLVARLLLETGAFGFTRAPAHASKPQDLCQSALVDFTSEVRSADQTLKGEQVPLPEKDYSAYGKAARAVASSDRMGEHDAAHWVSWSQKRLDEVHSYLDVLKGEKNAIEATQALRKMSNALIRFQGAAEKSKTPLLLSTLGEIEGLALEVQASFCSRKTNS